MNKRSVPDHLRSRLYLFVAAVKLGVSTEPSQIIRAAERLDVRGERDEIRRIAEKAAGGGLH